MRVKSEAKRCAILQAAMASFLDKGFEACTMTDIAQRAGGSKATLYAYFDSKESLFSAVIGDLCAARFAEAFDNLRFDGDLRQSLRDFSWSLMSTQLMPDLLAIRRRVLTAAEHSPIGRLFYQHGPLQGQGWLAQFLQGQMQAGRLRSGDPRAAGLYLLALVERDYLWRALLGALEPADLDDLRHHIDCAVDIFLTTYAPD